MKIGIFVTYIPPHIGGIEAVADNQIRALAAGGHQIQVVTSACGADKGREDRPNVIVWRIAAWNYFEEKMGAVFPVFSPSLLLRSYRVIRESDVIHAHDGFYLTSLVAAWWCLILRKPLVLTQHVDIVPHPSAIVMMVQRFAYATTGAFIFRVSRRIIVLNSRVRSFLRDRSVPESKIKFLPNGIDTNVFHPADNEGEVTSLRKKFSLPAGKSIILFVGRFVPKKGFTKLIDLNPIHDSVFAFAGGNAPNDDKRSDHIFLGKVNRDDIPLLYRAADTFVLPSSGEGFPMTIMEAMASGLSVITTRDPAYDLYNLSDNEIALIEPTVPNLQSALEDETSSKIGKRARSYATKNFSLDVHAKRLVELYEEMAG